MPDAVAPEVLWVPDAAAWEDWLAANHVAVPQGVWLRICHKGAHDVSVTYPEAVEIALCFGWIDGQARKHDAHSKVQRFTPRRARSLWSRINTERAERLVAEGRMRPAGQAEIDRARGDGRWDAAYAPPSEMRVPDDFLAALDANPAAKAFYDTLNRANTYAIAFRLHNAKKPETRARRVAQFLEMLERGEKLQ